MKTNGEKNPSTAPATNDWGRRNHVRTFVLMAVTILGIYLCYLMAAPFLPAIVWALALAILSNPLQKWLESKKVKPGLAAAICVSATFFIVAVPAAFVGKQLVQQAVSGAELINAKFESGEWQHAIENQPRLSSLVNLVGRHIDLPGTVKTFTGWLTGFAGPIVTGSVMQIIGFCITFYLLFFFLRDRHLTLSSLRSLSPLPATETKHMFGRIADTVYATVYGTLAVAALQGFLCGLMFWWLGLPLPLLWGVVMALLALVPVLGVFVIWIPAAIFLALEGSWGKALILSLWGAIVAGNVDNLLRPILMGNRLKFHTIPVFISILGGMLLFGSSGLILGPVILTTVTTLLEFWRSRVSPL